MTSTPGVDRSHPWSTSEDDDTPTILFDEAGAVFYIGSFSKMLAPSLRLGWIVAPAELASQVTVLRESIDLESSTLIQRAVSLFVEQGLMAGHLARFNAANRCRRDVLFDALAHYLGDRASWTRPEGGLFVWLTLREEIDTWALLEDAIAAGVAFVPGAAFALNGGSHNTLRLNFSNVQPELIPVAVERLAQVIKQKGK